MKVISIVEWNKNYENNRTRELKRMAWVPMPNRHDGDGYTELLSHKNGAAHFGAWCALVEVASRCDVRGTLVRDGGQAHDFESLQRMTRVPVRVWEEAVPRLVSIGWIKISETPSQSRTTMRDDAAEVVTPAQDGDYGMEWNGRKGKEGKQDTASAVAKVDPRYSDLFAKMKSAFESKNAEMDYKREGPAIKWIVEHALTRDDPGLFLKSMLNLFWKLTHDQREKIWFQQPFLPSVMRSGGLWPRLLTKLQDHAEDVNAAAQVADLTKDWWV